MKILVLFCLIMLISSCSEESVGTSSDIDIELAGIVVSESAEPIANASVALIDKGNAQMVDITLSDTLGKYRFQMVQPGTYSISAERGDTVKGVLPEFQITSDDTVKELDTLWMQKPGAIKGTVTLVGGAKKGIVQIYIPGTSYDAIADSTGAFVVSSIWPDSGYSLAYKCEGYTTVEIPQITVLSGDTLSMDPQQLIANNAPQNVRLTHDTLTNAVTIQWDTLMRDDIKGYVVARKDDPNSVSLPIDINQNFILDTLFIDSLHDTLFSMDSIKTFHYYVVGCTETGRTEYSVPVPVTVKVVRDSTPAIHGVTPGTGTILTGLSSYEINWKYQGVIEWVKIDYTLNGGVSWQELSGPIRNNGRYIWQQVSNVHADNCQIRVTDAKNPVFEGKSSPFSIKMTPVDEMLLNGDFSKGLEDWTEQVNGSDGLAKGTLSEENGQFKASVELCPTNEIWRIRLFQKPIVSFYKQYTYKLRFRAKAAEATTVMVDVNMPPNGGKEGEFYWVEPAPLTPEWRYFEMTINFSEDPKPDETLLFFNLGYRATDIWIDDVSLSVDGFSSLE